MTFRKVMVANRGEIAIRVFRACTELGMKTVAIYSHEDRYSIHRYKADEAFLIGEPGEPVAAYLDQEAILQIALDRAVDAIHPGYGFLSENADFARRCAEVGVAFIGPRPEVLEAFGDKVSARKIAEQAGVPVVPGTPGPVDDAAAVHDFVAGHGLPIMLKAAHGGGGRGMRIIRDAAAIDEAFRLASSEAASAFGSGELFCEKLVEDAKHIEVQILADSHGSRVHLMERDCSIQRRHQKVVEVAPAVSLGDGMRDRLYQAALSVAEAVDYTNAGTVEFLVTDADFYFIEVNPRLQVEHTITECITGHDIVQAQIIVAAGGRLSDPRVGIHNQASIGRTGFAIQCRITTEDPEAGFVPDTGKIRAYRSAAGFGIRLDTGTGGVGTIISSNYDTLIVKVTAFAATFPQASAKMERSLREFRIRGVKTNIPFLINVITDATFRAGQAHTAFVDQHPTLLQSAPRRDRGTKLLRAFAHTIVNGLPGQHTMLKRPEPLFPPVIPDAPAGPPPVSPAMAVFRAEGAEGLSRALFDQDALGLTDTTFRDAHQSLLATRMRTADMLAIAPATAHLGAHLFSLEMWGGATFDVAYRFLKEDPWARLRQLREAIPNILFQMLLRGANAVGYTNYPDNVVRAFVQEAAAAGIDVFRIFDALNWLPNMELAMEEVNKAGKIVEASLCYTGDIHDSERTKYDLDYYVNLGRELARRGAHILNIKDMAGLLKPLAARDLVVALRDTTGLPVHLHTHDTSGNGLTTYTMAAFAGVDVVDCALSSMSGLTSQPSLNALCATLEGHTRDPQLDRPEMQRLADYWEAVRELYYPFESGLKSSNAEVYWHEIPGGQYSNLRPRAIQLGLGDRWALIKQRYRDVSLALGDIIKVTPSSKVVADFAMFLVQNDLTIEEAQAQAERLDFPQSVVDFFAGRIGQPYGGFPEALQRAVLKGRPALTERVGETLDDHDFESARARLTERMGRAPRRHELVSDALYTSVFAEFLDHKDEFGSVEMLPTVNFFYGMDVGEEVKVDIEPGKTLIVKLVARGALTPDGHRTVFFELNGQPREVSVRDLHAEVAEARRPRADPTSPFEIGASMPGKVLQVLCRVGDQVEPGQTVLVVEAMKMETAITAGVSALVDAVLVEVGDTVEAGELLVRLRGEAALSA